MLLVETGLAAARAFLARRVVRALFGGVAGAAHVLLREALALVPVEMAHAQAGRGAQGVGRARRVLRALSRGVARLPDLDVCEALAFLRVEAAHALAHPARAPRVVRALLVRVAVRALVQLPQTLSGFLVVPAHALARAVRAALGVVGALFAGVALVVDVALREAQPLVAVVVIDALARATRDGRALGVCHALPLG